MTSTEKQNGLDISDPSHWETLWPRANHTEISLLPPSLLQLPPSAGEHRGKRRLVHKELAHSSLLWHQRTHRPTPGLSRVLQPHLLPDTAAPLVAQRRHLKAHHFLEVWPLPAEDTCFIFLISSSAYQPQMSLPYILISPFIS